MLVHATSVATHRAAAALGGFGALGGGSATSLGGGALGGFGATSTRHGTTTCGGHCIVILHKKIFFRFIRQNLVFCCINGFTRTRFIFGDRWYNTRP